MDFSLYYEIIKYYLRPICFNSNSNMSTSNWPDYEKTIKKASKQNNKKILKEVSIDI